MEEYRVLQRVWLPLAILLVCQTLVGAQGPLFPDPPGPTPAQPGTRPTTTRPTTRPTTSRPPPDPQRPLPDPPGPLSQTVRPTTRPPRPTRPTRPTTTMPPFALAPPSEYRLVNTIGSPGLGRVEAFYNGTWRPVCSTYRWDSHDADVLCRSLGYAKGVRASPRSFPPKEQEKDEDEDEYAGTPGRRLPRPVDERPAPPGVIPPSSPPPVLKLNLDFNCVGNENRLDECPGRWVPNCYNDAAAICFSAPATNDKRIDGIRLQTHPDQPPTSLMAIGKVQVLHRGFWGTICTRGSPFREEEASSVCRALGYKSGTHVYRGSLSLPNQGDPIFWFGQFDCKETTRDLGSCSKEQLGVAPCSSHYYDALVLCVNTTAPYNELLVESVRLTNTTRGKDWLMGRVEVRVAGTWGSVCERRRYSTVDWHANDARVLCRQQGFSNGIPVQSSVFGRKKLPVLYFNRDCPLGGTSLNGCRSPSPYREYDCTMGGAGVFCTNSEEDCPTSTSFSSGPRGPSGPRGAPAPPTPRTLPGGVTATPSAIPDKCVSRLRIVGSPEVEAEMRGKAGRVEYYNLGLWGPVCAVGFDDREAHVICKSLGLKTGRAMVNSSFGEGDGPNWLSHLQCAGNEENIHACLNRRGSNVLTSPSCSKQHQAGVVCEGDGEDKIQVRLSNKNIKKKEDTFNGVVQVLYKGHWGTICSNGWDDADASVVCREMGYATGFATSNNTKGAGMGSGPVWLEGVECQGNEKSIMDCLHSGWGEKSMFALCDHSNDAGALCIEGKKADKDKGKGQNTNNIASGTAKASSDNASSRHMISSYLAVFLIILSAFNMLK